MHRRLLFAGALPFLCNPDGPGGAPPANPPATPPASDPANPPANPPATPPANPPAADPAPPSDTPAPTPAPAGDLNSIQRQLEELRKENEGYKRRDDEARREKLTAEQRMKEDLERVTRENAELKAQQLRSKVAAEFKLPEALAARLIGTDEAALRADAAELAKYAPRTQIGSNTDPLNNGGTAPRFKRSQLQDLAFYNANREAIQAALKDGRIIDG